MFLDPDALKPVLSFIEVIALDESQDATGLKNAFIDVFKCNNLNSIINKSYFYHQMVQNVNYGKESGLTALLQEAHP